MTIVRRPVGSSDLKISRLGLGAWVMGGGDWVDGLGPQSDKQSIATISRATAMGINWVDTAPVYGYGHSEEVVGAALRQVPPPERPLVFTKAGLVWDHDSPSEKPVRDLRPATLRREVEASLRRLKVERIDLYQVHWPDDRGTPVEDSWGEMGRFLDEGKARAIGVCNFDIGLLERCELIRHVDSVQPPFSAIHRDAALDVIPWALDHGTAVIVYSPMESGLLTDQFSIERLRELPEADFRHRSDRFQEPALSRSLALRNALRPIAERHGTTVAAIAVAWTLQWPGVTGAIVGARRPDQVDGWIGAASLALSPRDLAEIAAGIRLTQAGSGPPGPPAH